ncbi:MAG TPA: hypothetical protein PKD16_01070 [Saprospiraceae bacterium]|jgi:hypothetical protein|nr:hypothetical protein [Saprospiraceae bacterium]
MRISLILTIFILGVYNCWAQQTPTTSQTSSNCDPVKIVVQDEEIYLKVVPPSPISFPCDDNEDLDGDGILNGVDPDKDGDGKLNIVEMDTQYDNDIDSDGKTNECDLDSDGDGVTDDLDACYSVPGSEANGCNPRERQVYWLHGYQGNEHSWNLAGNDIQSKFLVKSHLPTYNASQSSLSTAAGSVINTITGINHNNETSRARDFVIAHSMGGLVARTMGPIQIDGKNAYNGTITFGTPHQGAAAANTLLFKPDVLNNYLNFACKSLVPPLVFESLNTSLWGSLAVGFGLAGGVVDAGCDAVTNTILPEILPFATTGIEAELTTYAASSIPPMATEHNAVFYGIETSDDHTLTPRFFGSILPGSTPNELGLYGADASDEKGIGAFNTAQDLYTTKYTFWQNQSVSWWQWIALPIGITNQLHIDKMRAAWKKGVDWFPTLDPSWQDVIGAADNSIVENGCECTYYEYGDPYQTITFQSGDCGDHEDSLNSSFTEDDYYGTAQPHWVCNKIYTNQTTFRPNDGFILAESAANGPGNTYPVQYMDGSNHMQMRNDSKTAKAMTDIFEHGLGGSYFATKKR